MKKNRIIFTLIAIGILFTIYSIFLIIQLSNPVSIKQDTRIHENISTDTSYDYRKPQLMDEIEPSESYTPIGPFKCSGTCTHTLYFLGLGLRPFFQIGAIGSLNYERLHRFIFTNDPLEKIEPLILQKSGPECNGTFVNVKLILYAPLMKSEEKKLRTLMSGVNIYNDNILVNGVVATSDILEIAKMSSVKSIIHQDYPTGCIALAGWPCPPPKSAFTGTCA